MPTRLISCLFIIFVLIGALFLIGKDISTAKDILIVKNDRGGILAERMKEVASLRERDARVEIRGRVCLSSCTMYLGVEDVCVEPGVTFGFHGPTSYGRPLSPERFENWSQIIASHYPIEQLRQWFLETARYRTNGYYRVSGQQLINMGIPSC